MTVQFEVRALRDGKWRTEYRSSDQGEAIRCAKSIFSTMLCTGVRVIRETYVADQGVFMEKTIYRNKGAHTADKPVAEGGSDYTPGDVEIVAPPPKEQSSFTKKVVLLLCVAVAIFIALKAGRYLV